MITSPAFAGKRYAVLGLARSGMATVEALLASGAEVTAWDRRPGPREELAGRATIADPLEIDLAGFDGVVLSPGVPLNTHPIAARARAAGVPLIGDIELFAQARASLPPHKVVGITGTNGKSTTTALIHHIVKTAGVPTTMGGNIGLPILGQDPLPEGGVYVLELSSYQIDLTYSLDCDVAVLLNITPDHLDRYRDFAAYRESKLRLFQLQADRRVGVIATPDAELIQKVLNTLPRPDVVAYPALASEILEHYLQASAPALQGPHNAQNIWAAMQVVEALGLPLAAFEAGVKSYPGLPHRMEIVAEHNGVLFVNDSKATNPASTAPALAAYPRVHWIVGGLPKGDDLDECAPHFGHVVAAYTIGEAGPHFADLLEAVMHVERCEMLCEATRRALAAAQPGEVILLSPACASFDQFRDYEMRGEAFRRIVSELTGNGAPAAWSAA
ncbi:MAG: UDP-N-acetylmuramoyl-L-alanine--D-glutamate ligase [Sphingomonadales bacterium 32-68-7]|nr:MAG: UDP-N-acetylmuramoyl-L-alanine--D-glutamate ligase [Sphingomonadales bacterium 12-68-11]OYX08414.1 MAG: UDP-N-acetylmuramoyl-L-alanine--D-glutamate ligase [Sphingomonadales bacterium 32-68-7]